MASGHQSFVKGVFEFGDGFGVGFVAAKDSAPDLGLGTQSCKGWEFQNGGIFDVGDAVVRILLQKSFENGAGLIAIFGEVIALFHLLRS